MDKELLHRPTLEALLTLATSDVRWRSRGQLASDAGVTPATLSHALSGRRGLSDAAVQGLCSVIPGCTREALTVPWVARPGDLRTTDIEKRLRGVQDELTAMHRALRDYHNGG